MNDLSDLYYQHLLFDDGCKYTEVSARNKFPNVPITPELLEFIKHWNSIKTIIITGVFWKKMDAEITCDHGNKLLEILLSHDRIRETTEEQNLKDLCESIFPKDYTISIIFQWSSWEEM